MSIRSVGADERYVRQHSCSMCGFVGPWTDEWSWFGSMLEYDEYPERLIRACSSRCKRVAEAEGHRP